MATDDWQREMQRYLAHFNRAGKRPTILFTHTKSTTVWTPAVDVYETDEMIVVLFDLAGVDAEKTEVHAEPHLLVVRGVRRERHGPPEQRTFHTLEIPYGRFERTLHLPEGTDTAAASASYKDGLLEITLPKRQPRQVPISRQDAADDSGAATP
jgi:HSP20 family protein